MIPFILNLETKQYIVLRDTVCGKAIQKSKEILNTKFRRGLPKAADGRSHGDFKNIGNS